MGGCRHWCVVSTCLLLQCPAAAAPPRDSELSWLHQLVERPHLALSLAPGANFNFEARPVQGPSVNISVPLVDFGARNGSLIPGWCRRSPQNVVVDASGPGLLFVYNAGVTFEGIVFNESHLIQMPHYMLLAYRKHNIINVNRERNLLQMPFSAFLMSALIQNIEASGKRMWEQVFNAAELAHFQKKLEQSPCTVGSERKRSLVKQVDKLAVWMYHYPANYADFVAAHLPVLALLLPELLRDPALQLLTYDRKFHLEYLDLLGVPEAQRLVFDPCFVYGANEVAYVERLAPDLQFQNHHPFVQLSPTFVSLVLPHLRASSQASLTGGKPEGPVLIVDRGDKLTAEEDRRQLENHDEVVGTLRAYFSTREVNSVRLSELSVQQQMALFQSAHAIFGVEGSGLVNSVFMTPGATLVRFMPEVRAHGGVDSCGHSLMHDIAEVIGFRHFSFLIRDAHGFNDALEVKLKRFRKFLHAAFPAAPAPPPPPARDGEL